MFDEWRKSILVPINKGMCKVVLIIRNQTNESYNEGERIIEHRLRGVTNVIKNQFSFMPKRSTMKKILLIRQLMKR
jgi:hypothetical protein